MPLVTGAIPNVGREQGKGERASRISQHLRMSSRHRSVSPQAHRYHLHSHQDDFPYLPSEHSPSLSITYKPRPQPPSLQLSGLPNLSAPTNVVSPRPMLSPKHSFSVDPVGNASPSKSDRVKTLERIAALAVQDNCDMSTSMPPIVGLSAADKDKTLPTPPVPSQKPISKPLADRPQANTLFPPTHFHPKPAEETPRTPTITAIASLKVPRTIEEIKGGVSGLDALEARLLAEVGTRKVERDDQRPNVRSILPITIPRANASQGEPINDSAISSLTLPGVGGEETTPTVEKPKSVHSAELHDGEVTERGRKSRRGREDGYTSSGVKVDRRSDKKCSKRIKGEQNDGEIHQLRKIAQGRIAAWLGTIDPIAPPQSSVSPSPRRSPDPIPISLKEHPVPSEPTIHPFEDQDIEDESTTDAQPNPRSSGFVSIETLRLANQQIAADAPIPSSGTAQIGESPLLGKFLPARPNPGYDVHSARGGRGGQVTAVAAIWASATQASTKDSHSPKPLPEKIHRPMRPPTKEPVRGLPVNHRRSSPPLPKPKRPTGKEDVPPPGPTPVTTGNISSTRARMIKSTSVPAIVSSSLATPMLSSTASLARPAAHRSERAKLEAKVSQLAGGMQPIPEGRSEQASKAPEVKGSLAFGQARLRELIKRYQGQSNT